MLDTLKESNVNIKMYLTIYYLLQTIFNEPLPRSISLWGSVKLKT